MLIIYGAFRLGGIETFFLRLAKERFSLNLVTKFLFLSVRGKSDEIYIKQLEQFASVTFLDELLPDKFTFLAFFRAPFSLLYPFHCRKIQVMLNGISVIHTSDAHCAYVGNRLANKVNVDIPITIGVYHEKQFTWGNNSVLPYFEKKNREFFYNFIPRNNIVTFNSNMVQSFASVGYDIKGANYFPLGIDLPEVSTQPKERESLSVLRVVSVGRLTDFKTYNCWMLDVVKELKQRNISIEYTIYGEGSLESKMRAKIAELNIEDNVLLKGNLDYSEFHTISKFDVFIGSGTALLEASSLGLPCIVGIESIKEPVSYNYFSELSGTSYNEDGLFKKHKVSELLSKLHALNSVEYTKLSTRHVEKATEFSIKKCNKNFQKVFEQSSPVNIFQSFFMRFLYSTSYAFELLYMRINSNSAFSKKYTNK